MKEVITVGTTTYNIKKNGLFKDVEQPDPSLLVSVIVPMRNEARNIRKTLDALRCQTDQESVRLPHRIYEVLVLANNCTDNSYNIVLNYKKKYPTFPLHVAEVSLSGNKANIGTVRKMLMDEACQRLTTTGNLQGIIASTDSDSQVDSKWVYQIIQEIAKGCDAVGGRILTKSNRDTARLYHLRDVTYRILASKVESIIDPIVHDPWPRHFQYFGASLAVTCQTYKKCGGLPQVPYLEDMAFYNSLLKVDARVRMSPDVKVMTSTRLKGKVEIGFSEQLRLWRNNKIKNIPQYVESADSLMQKFINRQLLRNCWKQYQETKTLDQHCLKLIAKNLFINRSFVGKQIMDNLYFGTLWQKVEKKLDSNGWHSHWPHENITEAIDKLKQFIY